MKIIGINDLEEKIKEQNMKKKLITFAILVVLVIIIILICLYIGNKPFRDFMDKYVLMKNIVENNTTTIYLDESKNYEVCAYDKYISVLNQNILTGYNSSGKQEYELKIEITTPLVDTNNKYLLIAEKGKQKIYLISGNTIVWENQLEGNISHVSVNKNGYVSVILTGTTYKSIVQTFDNTGKALFKIFLSTTTAMDSKISNDNKYLSFAEVSTNGTLVQSMIKTVSMENAQSESILYTINSPNNAIPLSIKYHDGNKLICMYDTSIHCIQNQNDEEILSFKEEGRKITFGDIELNNYIFRIMEKSELLNTESTIEIMNTSNKKISVYTVDSAVKEVYSHDNKIALNLGSEVHFIGTNGWLIKKYISNQEVRKITLNENFAAIIYRNKIEIVEL